MQCDQIMILTFIAFDSESRDGGRQVQALLIYWEDLLTYKPLAAGCFQGPLSLMDLISFLYSTSF